MQLDANVVTRPRCTGRGSGWMGIGFMLPD